MTIVCYLYAYVVLVLLHILVDNSSASCVFDDEKDLPGAVCPTWFRAVTAENNSYTCVCGEDLPISDSIDCTEQPPHVEINVYAVCVYYITECNITVAGACPYTLHSAKNTTDFFFALPTNVSQLNDYMCGPLNRKGLLCGQCMDGYSPSVLSYDRKCVECSNGDAWNWAVYCIITLVPTTILFLVFMIFRVNLNAPPLSAFVFISQFFSVPILIEQIQFGIETYPHSTAPLLIYNILTAFYGIWNLDFLRVLIPPFCLPGVRNSIHALAVEYLVAFYPLLLVVLAYVIIKLHDRGTWLVVVTWRPFHRCLIRISRSWDPHASVMNTFATFLLLSYWKITYTSMSFFTGGSLVSVSGDIVDSGLFFYDASVKLFHGQHFLFAMMAIGILLVFVVVPPVVLLLYPTRAARLCLERLHVNMANVSAFMDVFQGHFKDGTGGTWDWRGFSAAYLLLRLILLAVGCFVDWTTYVYFVPLSYGLVFLVLLILLIGRPYKKLVHTLADSLLMVLAACFLLALSVCLNTVLRDSSYPFWLEVVAIAIYAVPQAFLAFVCIWWLEKRCGCFKRLAHSCQRSSRQENELEELPDRLENPQNYTYIYQ